MTKSNKQIVIAAAVASIVGAGAILIESFGTRDATDCLDGEQIQFWTNKAYSGVMPVGVELDDVVTGLVIGADHPVRQVRTIPVAGDPSKLHVYQKVP